MNLIDAFPAAIWPLINILLLVALALYSWPRRRLPGVLPFSAALFLAALWATGSLMEYISIDPNVKKFWIQFQAAWQLPAATGITCFILDYVWPGRFVTRRVVALLSIPSLFFFILIFTNDYHHWIWRDIILNGRPNPVLGPGGWIGIAVGYTFVIVDFIVFAWLFLQSPQHRGFVLIMLAGQLSLRTLYLLERANVLLLEVPRDVYGIAVAFVMYAFALFRYQVLDPVPFARQMATAQMRDGMLVLDNEGRLASLNRAAEAILGEKAKNTIRKPVQLLLPAYPFDQSPEMEGEIEITLGTEKVRQYTLAVSLLKDWRRLPVGRLLLLHDVTAQKQAQAQLLKQQQTLATLHERERLARELHDSIGQVLGYASLQLEAACRLMNKGQVDEASSQLGRMAVVLQDAHADVRTHILDLQAAPAPQQPYFDALRHYLKGFTNNQGIQALLSVADDLDEDYFSPDDRMQIFRILQEALSNARKHGKARCVEVSFKREDHLVHLSVQDDGAGFDTDQFSRATENHFGLRFMRERAEELGGSLAVISQPGQGTRVVLEIPERENN
jgi:signal transduction histidine kinase